MAKITGGKTLSRDRVEMVPQELCDMCKTVFTRLLAAGAPVETAKVGALNFLFLRTLNPALNTSYLDDPVLGTLGGDPEARTTFTTLSRLFQNVVNQTEPRAEYMVPFRNLVRDYQPVMQDFIDGILTKGTVQTGD